MAGNNSTSHGHARRGAASKTYLAWRGMKVRCLCPANRRYKDYGGRGIKICDRWLGSFANFLTDMGEAPSGASLDRIDVNGNYEPANCRWTSTKVQARNRRNSVYLEANGERLPLVEWANKIGIRVQSLRSRIEHGWPAEKIVSPLRHPRGPTRVKR